MMVPLDLLLPVASLPGVPWRLLGLVPLVVGIALNLAADRALKVAGTTVKPLLETTSLVTGGVFSVTRNPMYFGFILLLVGLWALLGSLTPGIAVLAFAGLIDRYYVRPEETKLTLAFGDAYVRYCRQVRRWI